MTARVCLPVVGLVAILCGAPVAAQESGTQASDRLRREPDDRGAGIRLGDHILFGGRLTATVDDLHEARDGADALQRTSEVDGGAQFQVSWRPSRDFEAYGKAASLASSTARGEVRVYEAFVVARRIGGSPFDVQIGRQRIRDTREWFFDEYVDGARIRANVTGWRLEGLVARSLFAGPESERARHDKQHVMFSASRRVWRRTRVESFVLARNDTSARDEDPLWIGTTFASTAGGPTRFWMTTALRRGHSAAGELGGWAIDGGVSRRLRLPLKPVITLGYARGSGDGRPGDRVDSTFRQTGLEDNEGRFDGAKVFAYYGAALQPELSNLQIFTAAVGIRPRRRTSLDVIVHRYEQVALRAGTTATALRWRTSGRAHHLADEIDAVASFRLAPAVDVNITAAVVRAGAASTARATVFEWRPQIRIYF